MITCDVKNKDRDTPMIKNSRLRYEDLLMMIENGIPFYHFLHVIHLPVAAESIAFVSVHVNTTFRVYQGGNGNDV